MSNHEVISTSSYWQFYIQQLVMSLQSSYTVVNILSKTSSLHMILIYFEIPIQICQETLDIISTMLSVNHITSLHLAHTNPSGIIFNKFKYNYINLNKGPLTLSMKISPCTEKGTSTRLFVTICDENHIMFSFNPILDIPQRS